MKVVSGARVGDIYEYIGRHPRTNVDLSKQDYGDTADWLLVGLADAAEQVQAYIHDSTIDATGALCGDGDGEPDDRRDRRRRLGRPRRRRGGVALTGAGSNALNKVYAQVRAYIDGDTRDAHAIRHGVSRAGSPPRASA